MSMFSFNALIVDDDPIARKTVRFALEHEDFVCTEATDGDQALERLAKSNFDLVVTDLCMPKMHGHSLVIELLAHDPRPLVVVHSGFDDPRLTREMMVRGVDDIVYKPSNYAAFAAKVRVLTERRYMTTCVSKSEMNSHEGPEPDSDQSQQAIDVYLSSMMPDSKIEDLVRFLQQDPALSADVIRKANGIELNKSGKAAGDVREAVCRLGFRRVADLALEQLRSAGR